MPAEIAVRLAIRCWDEPGLAALGTKGASRQQREGFDVVRAYDGEVAAVDGGYLSDA